MKWIVKGHQFDDYEEKLKNQYGMRIQQIWVFGGGIIGEECLRCFGDILDIQGVIDSDLKKVGSHILGKKVITFEEYKESNREAIIIVCVGKNYQKEIINLLRESDLLEGLDFITWEFFREKIGPFLALYEKERLYLPMIQISVTERCTLKCKKCAHGCNYVDNLKKDLSVDFYKKTVEIFFETVDTVGNLVVLGGEPFLYPELQELIGFIGKRYRNQIGRLTITTNGTVNITDGLMDTIRKYGCFVDISNYSKQLPRLRKQYESLCGKLKDWGIRFSFGDDELVWMDYGFDHVNHGEDISFMQTVFDSCTTPCREIRGNNFYYCIQARAMSENRPFSVDKEDCLDLSSLNGVEGKRKLFEYDRGFSEKGYLDMCNYCYGSEAVDYPIPAAEQEKRKG